MCKIKATTASYYAMFLVCIQDLGSGSCVKAGIGLFSQAGSHRTRGHGLKLYQERIL